MEYGLAWSPRLSGIGRQLDHGGTLSDWDIAEPHADALVESLRSFGYSPQAAVADLVDNSISAGARNIDVTFHWAGSRSWVAIQDDGAGMDEETLLNAMRPGSRSPLETRADADLGRFGLGLKTASFSQARELTVVSRAGSAPEPATRRWDLDVVAATREWRLLRNPSTNIPALAADTGTTVLWTKCDRLVGDVEADDEHAQRRFLSVAGEVEKHLGATFHRFMAGRSKVRLRMNGREISPWDPFMERHRATQQLPSDTLVCQGELVSVTPYILPHRSKLGESDQEAGAGPKGWNPHQGFYLYRGGRLLVMGDWLGVGGAKDEHTKLARIRVDFPASLDLLWQVDVKKSSARVPGALRQDLTRIARATRNQAEKVYRQRGQVVSRSKGNDFVLAWHQIKTRDGETRYQVNRKHPVIEGLFASTTDRRSAERAIRFIEETIPTTMIGVSIASSLDHQAMPFGQDASEVGVLLGAVHANLVSAGVPSDVAVARLETAEPFVHYPAAVQAFKESL